MDNKELLKQLKDCLRLCDELTEEKNELENKLKEEEDLNKELSETLKDANNAVIDSMGILENTINSINDFRENVIIYQKYVEVIINEIDNKVQSMLDNKENREEELKILKGETEKIKKEIIRLNKEIS